MGLPFNIYSTPSYNPMEKEIIDVPSSDEENDFIISKRARIDEGSSTIYDLGVQSPIIWSDIENEEEDPINEENPTMEEIPVEEEEEEEEDPEEDPIEEPLENEIHDEDMDNIEEQGGEDPPQDDPPSILDDDVVPLVSQEVHTVMTLLYNRTRKGMQEEVYTSSKKFFFDY